MGVTHRHLDVAVTGETFGLGQRRAVAKQLSDVSVTTGGMEVGDAFRREVFDADAFQILLDHQPGPPAAQLGKQFLAHRVARQPVPEHGHELRVQWNHVTPTMLGEVRLHGDRWRHGRQVEALRRERCNLISAEAGHIRKHVDASSAFAVEALDRLLTLASRLDELLHLIGLEGSPTATNIDFCIKPLKTNERIGRGTLRFNEPSTELVDGLDVVVIGAVAQVVGRGSLR